MRITCLLPAPGIPVQGPSGGSAHVRGLVRALRVEHEVEVVAALRADRRGSFGEELGGVHEVGVPGWPSWLEPWRDLREVRAARRVAWKVIKDARRAPAPDLVIERHSLWSDAGWRVHDMLGVPWVLEVNAPPVAERERFERLRQPALAARWERQVLQAAPVIVTVSTWLRDWLVHDLGCRKVVLLPNGVDPRQGHRATGRARLGLGADEPVIGFVGSMKPWHGVGRLARVAQQVGARLALLVSVPLLRWIGWVCRFVPVSWRGLTTATGSEPNSGVHQENRVEASVPFVDHACFFASLQSTTTFRRGETPVSG